MAEAKFDLEDRLLEFAVRIIRVAESMHRSPAGIFAASIRTAEANREKSKSR
jgi:hypothetical protein